MLCPDCEKNELTGKQKRCPSCNHTRQNIQNLQRYWRKHESSLRDHREYKKRTKGYQKRTIVICKCPNCKNVFEIKGGVMIRGEGTQERPLYKNCGCFREAIHVEYAEWGRA
jgi:hypothetical protein